MFTYILATRMLTPCLISRVLYLWSVYGTRRLIVYPSSLSSQLVEKHAQELDWGKQLKCPCQTPSCRVHCVESKRLREPCRQEGEPWRARLFAQDLFLVSERAHLMWGWREGQVLTEVSLLWARRNAGKRSYQMIVLVGVSTRHYHFSFESQVHRR